MTRGLRYTKPSLASAPLGGARVRVYAKHPLYFMGSLRVAAFCLSYLTFLFFVLSCFYRVLVFCRFAYLVFVFTLSL